MLPSVRKKLKTLSDGNKGLQDIIRTLTESTEILSVEKQTSGIHNTKITLKIDKGSNIPAQERYEERVHFYNRIPLPVAIPAQAVYPVGDINQAISVLNIQYGCDLTTDDVEFVGGSLVAKETSLGYFTPQETPECTNVLNLNWFSRVSDVEREKVAWENQDMLGGMTPSLVKVGQQWRFRSTSDGGSLTDQSVFVSSSAVEKRINVKYQEPVSEISVIEKLINQEPEHFSLKLIYAFDDNRVKDLYSGEYRDDLTKMDIFNKWLVGPHQTNTNVSIATYSYDELWTRYPELDNDEAAADVIPSIYQGEYPYIPLQESEDPLFIIEVNILYCPNPDCSPSNLDLRRFNHVLPANALTKTIHVEVTVDGVKTTAVLQPEAEEDTVIDMIRRFLTQADVQVEDGGGGVGEFQFYSRTIRGGDGSAGSNQEPEIEEPIDTPPGPGGGSIPGLQTNRKISLSILPAPNNAIATDLFEWLITYDPEDPWRPNDWDAVVAAARQFGFTVRSCGFEEFPGF